MSDETPVITEVAQVEGTIVEEQAAPPATPPAPEAPKQEDKFAAKFAALSRQEKTIKQKQAELARKEAEIAAKEKVSLIEDAIKAKKLLPSMKQWALSMTSENLKGFLELAPIMNVSNEKYTDVSPTVIPMEKEVTLSESDLFMIGGLGISKEQFLAGKKKNGY